MDRLLESVDQQASSAAMNLIAVTKEQFDEGLFQHFAKNPVWDFLSLTKEQYLAKGRDQKLEWMKHYYYYTMKNSEPLLFLSFLSK